MDQCATERSNMTVNDGDSSICKSGMILIQRYMSLQNNTLAALCNAAQEPGLTASYLTLIKRHGNLKANEVRLPHVFDIIALLAQRIPEDLTQQAKQPKDLCVLMGGFASEAEEFMRLSPKFFFITCDLLEVNVSQWDVGQRTQLVVPVIWKGGHYYIISGHKDIPLYRIHHPKDFFFSNDGKALLLRMIAHWYCDSDEKGSVVDLHYTQDGKNTFYCLPNISGSDDWPIELWDDLNEDEINAIIPYEVVHEPVIPFNQKYSVQLVQLNDASNIIEVKFPKKE
mmetsp:Transcript_39/g.54  ORF Transcript_39/g.54 Transcript_39/m.54 type:complete len:283 (-) Transcript_39:68-916(-)